MTYLSLHPLTIREWREKNGGKNTAMGVMHLKKREPAKDVADDWGNCHREPTGFDNSQTSAILVTSLRTPCRLKLNPKTR
jgi:hypothetical protein